MVVFPNCKINLGLSILDKRENGYHNLQSVFLPVQLCDVLEIVEAEKDQIFIYGKKVNGDPKKNSCYKALEILRGVRTFPFVHIHLFKKIPMGAGLGGGSSDGAFALKLLNEKFCLGFSEGELAKFALEIGSDCVFFIYNKPMLVEGQGEILSEFEINLNDYFIGIAYPEIHVDTAIAYGLYDEFKNQSIIKSKNSLKENYQNLKPEKWRDLIINDFEKVILPKYPKIAILKNTFYEEGASFALMSGSGSSVFGIFKKDIYLNIIKLFKSQNPKIFICDLQF